MKFAAQVILLLFLSASYATAASQPKVLCSDVPAPDQIFRGEYCAGLQEMHEPIVPLEGHPESLEVYRFLWFRSFHPAVIIRIDIARNMTGFLTLHAAKTITSFSDLQVVTADKPINSTTTLSRQQVAVFRKLVASKKFWTLPSQFHLDMGFGPFSSPLPKGQEIVVSDGAQWVIEGQSRSRYHIIGDEGGFPGPVWDIGLAMLHSAQRENPSWLMGPVY